MRMSAKRLLAVILAGLMILPLAACGKTDDPGDGTTPVGTQNQDEVETGDPNYTCNLPENLNFGNTEVVIMSKTDAYCSDELKSEKMGLGTLSDAVYERNATVENQLKVKLTVLFMDDVAGAVDRMVSAGDRSVDIFTLESFMGIGKAMEGKFLNLKDTLYTDTSKHYWSQEYNEIVTYTDQNMQFLATSPAALTLFRLSFFTIFNKKLMEERHLPELYDVVENGEWTLDYQYQITTDIWVDTNGDGTRSMADFYGHITGSRISMDPYPVACNIHLVVRDENGDQYFDAEQQKNMITMAEKVSQLCTSPGTVLIGGFLDNVEGDTVITKFAAEEGVMATTLFNAMEHHINELADISYGIAPLPKMTKEQEKYHTYVQDRVTCFGISAAIGDEERQDVLSAVMESIAYNSYVIVRPAYYDTTLSLRFMQDRRSGDMLDLMFESVSFDLCTIIGMGGVKNDLRTLLPSRNPPIASRFKMWSTKLQGTVDNQNKTLDRMLENMGG